MSRFALLLRKDLLLLARSRPLLAVLIIYPLVLSLLVGGVLGGQGTRPRVAFVNEDDIPNIVHIGDRSFDFGRIVRQAGKRVQLVNLTLPRARRALDDGDVVAVIIVPRGFIAELSSLIASPQVELLTNRNAYEERILRETQAFVYTLNSEVQTEYIRSNSHFLDVLVSGGKARRAGPDVQRARARLPRARASRPSRRGCPRTARRASSSTRSSPSPARPRPRSAWRTRRSRRPRIPSGSSSARPGAARTCSGRRCRATAWLSRWHS